MSTNGCAIILGAVSWVALRRVGMHLRKMSKLSARIRPIIAYFANHTKTEFYFRMVSAPAGGASSEIVREMGKP